MDTSKYKMLRIRELAMHALFLAAACASVLAVGLICVFLFANGIPAMGKIGLFDFLLGTKWKPGNDIYGILPMILGSIYVTAGAVVLGVPIGILMAIFMARFCPPRLYKILKPVVDLLAGIPSIVYGFFWPDCVGSLCAQHFWRHRHQYFDSGYFVGHHDFAQRD